MPLSYAHLKKNVRTIDFDYDGEEVVITYKPMEISPALGQEMASEETKEPLVLALDRALVKWDVVENEGDTEPMPCDAEVLRGFGSRFLNAIMQAIMKDIQPSKN
jgi:hypothetical protein